MYEYLIGAGEMRSGTTLLYEQLIKHPGIRKGVRKELHYFDTAENPDKGEYDALFTPGEGLKLDITPFYMYYTPAIERIGQVLDPRKVAVVVLLRDPIERAFSHYRMRKSQNMEDQPFAATFDLEKDRTARSFHDLQLYSYFTRGRYSPQLELLYKTFPRENVKVFLFEDYVAHQQKCIDEICDLVGIDHMQVESGHANKTVMKVKSRTLNDLVKKLARMMPKALRMDWMRKLRRKVSSANERKDVKESIEPDFEKQLVHYYLDDVKKLRDGYGLDVSLWKHFGTLV